VIRDGEIVEGENGEKECKGLFFVLPYLFFNFVKNVLKQSRNEKS
jgi:hypothetical protein